MEEKNTHYLSRSALAEKLGVSLKELTQQLISAGWLLHHPVNTSKNDTSNNDSLSQWQLTEKGKFEGGVYRQSKKFGEYIVWPESVLAHPAIIEITASLISATQIGKHVDLPANIINQLLANIGWLEPFAKGWNITSIGQQQGGVQQSNDQTGVPYVMWSRGLLSHSFLQTKISHFKGEPDATPTALLGDQTYYTTIDGYRVLSRDELLIAHTLYINNICAVYRQAMMVEGGDIIEPTFYLPHSCVYVFFHPSQVSPHILAQQLELQTKISSQAIRSVFIGSDDLFNLNHVLLKAFISLGVTV
jgi:hypothetical protein